MELFNNAGTKIRKWAAALFVIESVAAFISGIVTMLSDDDQFFVGILVMVVGIVVAFITSLFLSAFGELVESTTENKNINEEILSKLEEQYPTPRPATYANPAASPAAVARQNVSGETFSIKPAQPAANPDMWYCTSCGTQNSRNYYQCKKCGAQRTSN